MATALGSTTWDTKRVYITWRNPLTQAMEAGTWKATANARIVNTAADGKRSVFRPGVLGQGSLSVTEGQNSLDVLLPIVDDPENSPQGGQITLLVTFNSGGTETFLLSPLLSWPDAGTDLAATYDPSVSPVAPPLILVGVAGGVARLDSTGAVLDGSGSKGIVSDGSVARIVRITQAAYNALPTKDAATLYVIV